MEKQDLKQLSQFIKKYGIPEVLVCMGICINGKSDDLYEKYFFYPEDDEDDQTDDYLKGYNEGFTKGSIGLDGAYNDGYTAGYAKAKSELEPKEESTNNYGVKIFNHLDN